MAEEKRNLRETSDEFVPDIRSKVMQELKDKKIKMRRPFVFIAEKIGLESAVVTFILLGVFSASVIFYFLKKTGILKFLSFGYPGLKVFFFHLPYDYIAIFIFSILLAVFFANKLEIFSGKCFRTRSFCVYFFLTALILGIFFASIGTGNLLKKWLKDKLPADMGIYEEEIMKDIGKQRP